MWKVLWGFIFRALASRMRPGQEGQEPCPKNGLPEYLEQVEFDSPRYKKTGIWVSLEFVRIILNFIVCDYLGILRTWPIRICARREISL